MKNVIIVIVFVILGGVGVYLLTSGSSTFKGFGSNQDSDSDTTQSQDIEQVGEMEKMEQENKSETVIGQSVDGRDITAYHFGSGESRILFVGGIHGGYSWNTALVAYELIDHLTKNTEIVPDNVKVTIIPVLNPDGLQKVVNTTGSFTTSDVSQSQTDRVAGRFNANAVDLNRNFDCDWQAEAKWQNKSVSGGTSAFSEPESLAIRNYIDTHEIKAVVVWYSAAGGVFASNCHEGVLAETSTLTNVYAKASGYKAYENFNFYEVTGDMTNWLAKKNIPAISVLLSTHESTEWNKNRLGIEALLNHYASE